MMIGYSVQSPDDAISRPIIEIPTYREIASLCVGKQYVLEKFARNDMTNISQKNIIALSAAYQGGCFHFRYLVTKKTQVKEISDERKKLFWNHHNFIYAAEQLCCCGTIGTTGAIEFQSSSS
jgi:hypothetical protein